MTIKMVAENEVVMSSEDQDQMEEGVAPGKLPALKRRGNDNMNLAAVPLVEKTFELPKLTDPHFRPDDNDLEREYNRNKKISHKVRLANLTRGRPPPNAFDDYMYADDSINDYTQFPQTFFRASAVIKKLPLPGKNGIFATRETVPSAGLKGFVLRTDRYPSRSPIEDVMRGTPENLTQRERLAAEMEFMEEMRSFKRRKEFMPHREPVDMGLGGHKVVLFERMDIMGEIQKLKHVRLPAKAKDLYVGRGFKLPTSHALNNPNLINIKEYTFLEIPRRPSKLKSIRTMRRKRPTNNQLNLDLANSNYGGKHLKLCIGNTGIGRSQPSAMSDPSVGQRKEAPSVNQSAPTEIGSLQSRMSVRTDGDTSNPATQDAPTVKLGEIQPDNQPEDTTKPDEPNQHSPSHNAVSDNQFSPHNPLKNPQYRDLVTQEQLEELEKTFQKVTEESSPVTFVTVQSILPALASEKEEEFIGEVFQIATKDTPVGLAEFVALTCTCNTIERLAGSAKEAFQNVTTSQIENIVYKFMDLFVAIDRNQTGRVTRSSFEALLSTTFGKDVDQKSVLEAVNPALSLNSDEVTKSEFLALIPYFSTLDSKD